MLLVLKAKAWIDLTARKNAGEQVDSRDINKHKNDVFRLFGLLTAEMRIALPEPIRNDLADFLEKMLATPPDLRALGFSAMPLSDVIRNLSAIYGTNEKTEVP